MLYKNLPTKELNNVLFVRGCLDALAMLQFLLKGDVKNVKAICQARKDFKRLRCEFEADRKENLQKTSATNIPERIKNSILWQFYVRQHKYFSQLNNFKD